MPVPAAQPPQQDGAPQGGQNGFSDLVSLTFESLQNIGAVLEKAGAPPNALEKVRKMQMDFQELIEALQSGGDEGQEMAPKGPADAMAGTSGAQPMPS